MMPSLCLQQLSLLLLLLQATTTTAFSPGPTARTTSSLVKSSRERSVVLRSTVENIATSESASEEENGVTFLYEDDDEDEDVESTADNNNTGQRWQQLSPKVKAKIIQAAQERAIKNKKKREPIQNIKRRQLMFVKEQQREKKRLARVVRPIPLDQRTPLSVFRPGMVVPGIVISLTQFGAYVDIGTDVDGLLHISQLSTTTFVTHPREVLTPGDEISVTVKSTSIELKKLHLTMLPADIVQRQHDEKHDTDRIQLTELQVDDEVWGVMRRVTEYGAYIDIGAAVDGFLHFMDHPSFDGTTPLTDYLAVDARVRVWIHDVDGTVNRIKLTALRPTELPGPVREFVGM